MSSNNTSEETRREERAGIFRKKIMDAGFIRRVLDY